MGRLDPKQRRRLTWKFWLCNRSTLRIEHRGKVKPLPLGPPPWVWPVNRDEVEVLADCRKLDGVVEKQR